MLPSLYVQSNTKWGKVGRFDRNVVASGVWIGLLLVSHGDRELARRRERAEEIAKGDKGWLVDIVSFHSVLLCLFLRGLRVKITIPVGFAQNA